MREGVRVLGEGGFFEGEELFLDGEDAGEVGLGRAGLGGDGTRVGAGGGRGPVGEVAGFNLEGGVGAGGLEVGRAAGAEDADGAGIGRANFEGAGGVGGEGAGGGFDEEAGAGLGEADGGDEPAAQKTEAGFAGLHGVDAFVAVAGESRRADDDGAVGVEADDDAGEEGDVGAARRAGGEGGAGREPLRGGEGKGAAVFCGGDVARDGDELRGDLPNE